MEPTILYAPDLEGKPEAETTSRADVVTLREDTPSGARTLLFRLHAGGEIVPHGHAAPVPALDGVSGSLECVPSALPGMLKGDTAFPRKWRFTDGGYAVPMAFRMEFFGEPGTDAAFREVAEFLRAEVGGHLLETRLLEESGRFGGRHDFANPIGHQEALFHAFGTPDEHKYLRVYDAAHWPLPSNDVIRETVDFLGRYAAPAR